MITDVQLVGHIPITNRWRVPKAFDQAAFMTGNTLITRLKNRPGDQQAITLLDLPRQAFLVKDYQRMYRYLTSVDFITAKATVTKFEGGGVQALINDYNLLLPFGRYLTAPKRQALLEIYQALQRAYPLLAFNPSGLPEQLLSRIDPARSSELAEFTNKLTHYKTGIWLEPLNVGFGHTDQTLKAVYVSQHEHQFIHLALSHDGKRLVSADTSRVSVWDVGSGTVSNLIRKPGGEVTAVCISYDQKYVAAATRDGFVQVWPLENQQDSFILKGHEGAVLDILALPDGSVASASSDKTIKIWDLDKQKDIATLVGHKEGVSCLALATSYQYLVSGGGTHIFGAATHNNIKIWNWAKRELLFTLGSHEWPLDALAASSDSPYLVSSANTNVKVWDLDRRLEVHSINNFNRKVFSLCLIPQRNKLAIGDGNGWLSFFSLKSGKRVKTLNAHNMGVSASITDNLTGRIITTGGDKLIRIWEGVNTKSRLTRQAHTQAIESIVVADDGTVITGSNDHQIKAWSRKGEMLLVSFKGHEHWVSGMALGYQNRLYSVSWDKTVRVWNRVSGHQEFVWSEHEHELEAVAVSAGDKHLLVGDIKGNIICRSLENNNIIYTIKAHAGKIVAIKILAEDTQFVTAGEDGYLRVWSLHDGRLLNSSALMISDAEDVEDAPLTNSSRAVKISAVTLIPGTGELLVGSWGGDIGKWDISSKDATFEIEPHRCGITAIAVSPDKTWLASCTGLPYVASDDMLRIWNLQTKQLVADFCGQAPFTVVEFLSENQLVAGDKDGNLLCFRLNLEKNLAWT